MPDSQSDQASAHALQELDQVISKLQKVLHLENEQHLRDILSKMPADYLPLERLIPMADHLSRQISASTVSTPEMADGKTVVNSEEAIGAEAAPNRDNVESFRDEGNNRKSQIPEKNEQEGSGMKTSYPGESRLKTVLDQPKIETNIPLDEKPPERDFSDSAGPRNTEKLIRAANSSPENTSNSELPRHDKTSFNQALPIKNVLLSIRQDVISIQKDIYSQIMNSLLEYKIDLYKNLLRAGLDISCPEQFNKKANHKNFMLMRSLQQMIAKSSESNFESWYKFYSYSVFPQIREVVSKIDSVTKGSEGHRFESPPKGKEWANNLNDDFFIRAGDPHEPAGNVDTVARGGFDWKNLDKRIRESMRKALKHGRPKNSDSDGYIRLEKRRGDEGKQRNFVEIGQEFLYKKDRHDRNNLKGDFRKRKAGEHKKHKTQDFERKPQTHRPEERENYKRSHKGKELEHERTENHKREEQGHGKKGHKRENHEHDAKNNKHEYEKRKHEDNGKKYKREEMGKHDANEHKYKKHDESNSEKPEESKNENEDARYARGSNMKNKNDFRKADSKSNSGKNNDDRHHGKEFKSKQHKYKQERDYRDYQDFRGQYRDRKSRRKISFSDVGKYVKNTVSGLWKTVKGGFKNVRDYGKNYMKDWRSRKPKETGKYEEWRKEFVKEMKDVIRVLGGNPTLASLSEVPKSVSKFFGDGLGSIVGSFSDEWEEKSEMGPEGLHPGPEGMKEESMCYADSVCGEEEEQEEVNNDEEQWSESSSEGNTSDEGYVSEGYKTSETPYSDAPNHRGTEPAGQKTGSWYYDFAKHRADARRNPEYPRVSDSSWFLGLGRHRAYLRRKGIHLDDDGSWFISSARHRAKMRQKHTEVPDSPYFHSQASSKR